MELSNVASRNTTVEKTDVAKNTILYGPPGQGKHIVP